MNGKPTDLSTVLDKLKLKFDDRFSVAQVVRDQHGQGECYHPTLPPDGVVFVRSTEEVADVVTLCAEYNIAIIPFGAGTSLEGHLAAFKGGISIDMSQMDSILKVNAEDLDVTVQAGVRRKELNEYLRDTGLFFPVDPGANATLGGMAATRASGTNAVRYGTMRENVMSLKVVTPEGKIITTARRARKSSAGYDITGLYVGSEGTLGVITEVTLKLYGIPEHMAAAVCDFPTVDDAVKAVIIICQHGIPVSRMELLDALQMKAINAYSKTSYPEKPTLFFEFHGTKNSTKEQSETVSEIVKEHGASDFIWATRQEDLTRLWQARHDAYLASLAMAPGKQGMTTDVCVPISKLAECISNAQKLVAASTLLGTIVGHVGDGNFHTLLLFDVENEAEAAEAAEINKKIVENALSFDGTCTGEHGVGYGKIPYLDEELGDTLDVMAAVKQALDPSGIMNPGKVIPPGRLR